MVARVEAALVKSGGRRFSLYTASHPLLDVGFADYGKGLRNLRGMNLPQSTFVTVPGCASSRAEAILPTFGSIVGQ